MTRSELQNIIDTRLAQTGQSAIELDRAAGLVGATSLIRRGKVPSIERAAKLLDALGLELRVVRKCEPIDLLALQLAMQHTLWLAGLDLHKDAMPALVSRLAESYGGFENIFAKAAEDQRQAIFDVVYSTMLETPRKDFTGEAETAERAADKG